MTGLDVSQPLLRRRAAIWGLGLIGALGAVVILVATRLEVGLSPDGFIYLGAARQLLAGEPMTAMDPANFYDPVPLTIKPPGVPLLLAAVASLGLAVDQAARWTGALLFGATGVLAGVITLRLSKSVVAGLLVALLTLLPFDMINAHRLVASEALAYFCAFLCLLLLDLYCTDGGRRYLLGAAAAAGGALLARYASVGLPAAGVVSVLLLSRGPRTRRLVDAGLFGALAIAPTLFWLSRSWIGAEERAYGSLTFSWPHWPTELPTIAGSLTRFVWPSFVGYPHNAKPFSQWALVGLVALLLLALATGSLVRPRAAAVRSNLAGILVIFSVFHLAAHYAALSLLAPSSFLTVAYLLPVGLAVTILAVSFVAGLPPTGLWRPVLAGLAVAVVAVQIHHSAPLVARAALTGVGMNRFIPADAPVFSWLAETDSGRPLFSNLAPAVHYRTGRPTRYLPSKFSEVWRSDERSRFGRNPRFEAQMDELEREIIDRDAIILLMGSGIAKRFPTSDELLAKLPIELAVRYDGTAVYVRRAGDEATPPGGG